MFWVPQSPVGLISAEIGVLCHIPGHAIAQPQTPTLELVNIDQRSDFESVNRCGVICTISQLKKYTYRNLRNKDAGCSSKAAITKMGS